MGWLEKREKEYLKQMVQHFNIRKSINVIHHINRLKTENHMILLIDVEKQSTI